MKHLILIGIIASAGVGAGPEKRVFIAPDDHTDYWWSADEETYRAAFLEMLDFYLARIDATAGNPPEEQARWNCDGSYWMWTYERSRPPEAFAKLIQRVRDGHVSVPLNTLCVSIGGAPAEAVLRGSYYSGQVERRHNLRFRLAYTMENQTQPLGLWSLWRGSGAKYSWKGVCGCDSRVPDLGNRRREIYWAEGLDGQRMLVKWNSLLWGNRSIGGYAEARSPQAVVDQVTLESESNGFRERYPYDVIGCFGHGWDNLKTMETQFVQVAQTVNEEGGDRKIIVSNEEDFFAEFEQRYGTGLPVETCTYGNEWDLYSASLAETTSRVKRAVEKLRAAEAMATLCSILDPAFPSGREGLRDLAWVSLGLYWEHNFGMVGPPTGADGIAGRIAWQKALAENIESYVSDLHADAAARLGDLLPAGAGRQRFFVFNPLGWSRSDLADLPWDDVDPVHVVDAAGGQEVRSQIVVQDGRRCIRILAADVPPAGYRTYEIVPGAGVSFADAARIIDGNTIENSLYQVTVSENGAIASIKDLRRGGTELTRAVSGRTINDLGPGSGAVEVENAGPVSVTLRATSSGPLPHTSRVTLLRDIDRIEIRNDIEENFSTVLTWAFGFQLDVPDVWHEEVGAVIRARLTDGGGHYAPVNARYDWLTLNHFADMMGDAGLGVTLSNADCSFMKLGNSSVSTLDTSMAQIQVLAGGRVANGDNGLPRQGDETHFLQRFALRVHGSYDPADAMRFSMEHQNPLVCGLVTGKDPRLPSNQLSMLSVSNPDVLLWALKPAEEGMERGIIVRLWNLSNEPEEATLRMSSMERAVLTTHIETDETLLEVTPSGLTRTFRPQEMQTFRISSGEVSSVRFSRGDCNADSVLDISDPIRLLFSLFLAGGVLPCSDACDSNDDGGLDISDAIHVLRYQFLGAASPPAPFPDCGLDPTSDLLDCRSFAPCAGG